MTSLVSETVVPAVRAAQTETTPLIDAETQCVFTSYPRLMDNEGRIDAELLKLKRAFGIFKSRMSNIRDHGEARREIELILTNLRGFINKHRREIQHYLAAVVADGHKTAVRNELRSSSNECLVPILEEIDVFKRINLEMGCRRAPLREYRPYVESLDSVRGRLELIRFIEPPTLLE
jgi:hypothetical protein